MFFRRRLDPSARYCCSCWSTDNKKYSRRDVGDVRIFYRNYVSVFSEWITEPSWMWYVIRERILSTQTTLLVLATKCISEKNEKMHSEAHMCDYTSENDTAQNRSDNLSCCLILSSLVSVQMLTTGRKRHKRILFLVRHAFNVTIWHLGVVFSLASLRGR